MSSPASAQEYSSHQSVSGIINTYTEVTAFTACEDTIQVADASGFAAGDRVLVIQMQGADIRTADEPFFGEVTDINGAGNYEFTDIQAINGNTIEFQENLAKAYQPGNGLQMIRVPQYNGGVTVSGVLTAQEWNGTTGGVLVFEATDITLDANIDVTGTGFRGGDSTGTGDRYDLEGSDSWRMGPCDDFMDTVCSSTGTVYVTCDDGMQVSPTAAGGQDWTAYCGAAWHNAGTGTGCGCDIEVPDCDTILFDPADHASGQNFTCEGCTGYASHSEETAEKGEGIHVPVCGHRFSRGHLTNGGGGGNIHNGGGGGGSNYGSGGLGGKGYFETGSDPAQEVKLNARGHGGVALDGYYGSGRIFLGGGAGCGQGNDGEWTPGTDGGGIVLIQADEITATADTIKANGVDNTEMPATGGYDGAGGGGGGGAVMLDITNYTDALEVEATGGDGNDNIFDNGTDAYAPGGGGGGGAIGFSQAVTPANVATNVSEGLRGEQINNTSDSAAAQPYWRATSGDSGAVLHGIAFPEAEGACAQPVEWLHFNVNSKGSQVKLKWATAQENNNDYFEVQRSRRGEEWTTIGEVDGKRNSSQREDYTFADKDPLKGRSYYRIRQVDYNLDASYSGTEKVIRRSGNVFKGFHPNPVHRGGMVTFDYTADNNAELRLEMVDITGKVMKKKLYDLRSGRNTLDFGIPDVPHGVYIIKVYSGDGVSSHKVLVEE